MRTVDDLYSSILQDLKLHADAGLAAYARKWYDDEFKPYGVPKQAYAGILRTCKPQIKPLPLPLKLDLARRLIGSGYHEAADIANWVLALAVKELGPAHLEYLDRHLDYFHSWSTTDSFCIDVLQPLLWRYRAEVLSLLQTWNRSPNRWKRRASVVAFVRKVGASGEFTGEALVFCENLIHDSDDLVQKGVGWALKDNLRGSKSKVLEYIQDLRRRGVSSTITLYAIRDLKGFERESILAIRKER